MTYAADDAELHSARHILLLCRARLLTEVCEETSSISPQLRRVADLQRMLNQLRCDLRAVDAGDRAVITRATLLYGRLAKSWYASAPPRPSAS